MNKNLSSVHPSSFILSRGAESMSKKMVLALVAALLVLGSGIGLVTVVLSGWRHAPGPPPRPAVPALVIEENKDPVRAESVVEGHRDVPLHNRADRPVTVRLEQTDCGCARVLVWVAPREWEGLGEEAFRERAATASRTSTEGRQAGWQPLAPGGEAVTLPPRGHALARLKWETSSVGDHTFWARFWVDDGEDRGRRQMDVPVHFVAPVLLRPEDDPKGTEIDVGRLGAGEERTARLLCWSTTRDKVTLTPAPTGDPHLLCAAPQPLTPEETRALSDKIGRAVRCGYRVTVTVRERADDTRLDMGPFRRRVVWKTDLAAGHQVSAWVNGTVRGEVWLSSPSSADGGEGGKEEAFVDMGTFLPADAAPMSFTLESHDPQLRLTVDEQNTVDFLKAEMLDGEDGKPTGGDKTWRVRIRFRADSLFRGPFPNRDRSGYDTAELCSVVFLVSRPGQTGRPARRLLVPVRGTARPF
jgi:hypothetical protein